MLGKIIIWGWARLQKEEMCVRARACVFLYARAHVQDKWDILGGA